MSYELRPETIGRDGVPVLQWVNRDEPFRMSPSNVLEHTALDSPVDLFVATPARQQAPKLGPR